MPGAEIANTTRQVCSQRANFSQWSFSPVLKAVVVGKNDDRVVAIRTLFEGIEHAPDLLVDVRGRCINRLDRFFPHAGRYYRRVFTAIGGDPAAWLRHIFQIVGTVARRQLNGFQRELIVITFGHGPRSVGPIKTAHHEKRPVVLGAQDLDRAIGLFGVLLHLGRIVAIPIVRQHPPGPIGRGRTGNKVLRSGNNVRV